MNIATTVLIQKIILNGVKGGGSGKSPDREDKVILAMIVSAIAIIICFAVLVIYDMATTIKYPTYEVNGVVAYYDVRLSGKTKKVFVALKQTDGQIRWYNTNINPSECRKAQYGTAIPVIVVSSYHPFTSQWTHQSNLKFNPCR
jgi:hypothetical protein